MASYKHGVYTKETPTSLIPTTEVLSAVPFVVGIAPVNMVETPSVNEPKLCYSYAEAVEYFGMETPTVKESSGDLKVYDYSLSEFIYSTFNYYGNTPIVLVNVLDPTKHKKAADTVSITVDAKTGQATIAEFGILPKSLTITNPDGEPSNYTEGVDYITSFDDDGFLVIASLRDDETDEFKLKTGQALTVACEKLDPTMIETADIIGGVDVEGNKKGLELISDVYPKLRVIPTLILAPQWSTDPEVAAVMATKALAINGHFNAMALIDVNTSTCKKYSDVPNWKNQNNIVDANQILCWPKINMSGTMFSMSTALAGLIAKTDANYDGVPYASPSNKNFEATGLCLIDGSEVVFGNEEANYLNGEGIVTALNFIGGWKCWGNRTGICSTVNTFEKPVAQAKITITVPVVQQDVATALNRSFSSSFSYWYCNKWF